MGNTEDSKDLELKKIPRNPNMPIKDEEVEALLKKAAEQIGDTKKETSLKREEKSRENIDLQKKEEKKAKDLQKNTKPETKTESKAKDVNAGKKLADKSEETKGEKQFADKSKETKVEKKPVGESKDVKKAVEQSKEVKAENKPSNKLKEENKSVDKPDFGKNKNSEDVSKNFKVEDDVYVTKGVEKKDTSEKSYKMTAGEIVSAVFEGIWTGIKLIVLVLIATAIVGFFMSRDLMIRGRSGEQLSKQNMNVAPVALSVRLEERESGKAWNETVKKEKLTLEADDGRILVAQKIVIDKKNDNWVVILHGQNGSVEDIYDIGLRYASEGYNIFMPDLRAHGESEGSYYGMGWLDRLDVINWIDVILKDNPSANIILHGVDLGADTALMLSGEPLKESIKCIIAEGAYTSAWDAVKIEYKTRHADWPTFPMMHMLNPVAKVWGGYSLTEADAVKQVAKTDVPILLIRGQNDTFITEDMTKELDEAIASEHEVLTVATGTHEDCRFAEPDTYYNKVFEFVERYVK